KCVGSYLWYNVYGFHPYRGRGLGVGGAVTLWSFFFFSSRRRHTRSVSAFLLNRSSDLCLVLLLAVLLLLLLVAPCLNCLEAVKKPPPVAFKVMCLLPITIL